MNQAIVGAGPNQIDVQRRRRHRIDHAALRRLCGRLRAILADALRHFERLARQVGTNLIPVSPAVFRLPQRVGGKVKNMWIDRREKSPAEFAACENLLSEKASAKYSGPARCGDRNESACRHKRCPGRADRELRNRILRRRRDAIHGK